MTLAQRLQLAREKKQMTQQQLAELSGVRQATISKIESGKSASSTFLVPLAVALEIEAKWLATGIGPMETVADTATAELAARIAAASPRDRRLIELALLNPDEPLPEGISPSIRQLLDVVRTMIPEER